MRRAYAPLMRRAYAPQRILPLTVKNRLCTALMRRGDIRPSLLNYFALMRRAYAPR